jgi:hypothetical protein
MNVQAKDSTDVDKKKNDCAPKVTTTGDISARYS